ncbi:MAG: hypothetical protein KGL72_03310 [Actinomycetales bacterium]|nr:hypothetical protein [Actinomycetales bacterium]
MSEKYPPGTRKDHRRFCDVEQWTLVRGATGKAVRHHLTYELNLWDGRILRTRISHPVNQDSYLKNVWGHILKTQLQVTEPVFWECVMGGILPDRGQPAPVVSRKTLPLYLVRELVKLGVTQAELANLSTDAAASLLGELLAAEAEPS